MRRGPGSSPPFAAFAPAPAPGRMQQTGAKRPRRRWRAPSGAFEPLKLLRAYDQPFRGGLLPSKQGACPACRVQRKSCHGFGHSATDRRAWHFGRSAQVAVAKGDSSCSQPPVGLSPLQGSGARSSAARRDQAPRGHDDPAAILLADGIDAPQPGHEIALLHLDNAHPAFDQRGPAMDVTHDPTLDP